MRKFIITVGAMALSTSIASATLLVDDFAGTGGASSYVSDPSGAVSGSCSAAASSQTLTTNFNSIGDRMQMVDNTGSDGCVELQSNTVATGAYLAYSSAGNSSDGIAMVWWDVDDPTGATAELLNQTLFSFLLSFDDPGGTSSLDVTWEFCVSGAGGAACASRVTTFTDALPGPPPTTVVSWALASFTGGDGYLAVLAAIAGGSLLDGVHLTLRGDPNVDATLDQIVFNTPEPSTFVLLGSALVGVAMLRRRRKA